MQKSYCRHGTADSVKNPSSVSYTTPLGRQFGVGVDMYTLAELQCKLQRFHGFGFLSVEESSCTLRENGKIMLLVEPLNVVYVLII